MEKNEIKSLNNDIVKFCVKLHDAKFRKSNKLIFLDGFKTIEGVIDSNIEFEYFFAKEDFKLINKVKTKKLIIVNDAILKKISTTSSMSECAGIIKEPEIKKDDFKKLDKILLIEGIKDAGNLGTIIRSACAFSIDGIILFNNCVDLYNTKTIRASVQNIFKIPIIALKDIDFIKELKKERKLISTVVDSKKEFIDYKFKDKYILAFGSEAEGLDKEIVNLSDEKLTISMDNDVESLNLGVCVSVALALIKFR